MSTVKKVVVAQLVTGTWIVGRVETQDGFVDEAVEKSLAEGGVVIVTPLEIVMQPGRDGRAQLMLPPYGYPIIQFDITKDVERFFPAHSFVQYPDEAPQQIADYYMQSTSGIQIAPAGSVPPRHLQQVRP